MTNREIIKAFEDLIEVSRRLSGCRDMECLVCKENDRVKSGARLALEALKQSYPKINLESQLNRKYLSKVICDALDHNENDGCSNPACFKYYGRTK